jgi:hypothetical protein
MKLASESDVRATEEKIKLIEAQYDRVSRGDTDLNPVARELSLISLRRTINEMKEDIVRYRSTAASSASRS